MNVLLEHTPVHICVLTEMVAFSATVVQVTCCGLMG